MKRTVFLFIAALISSFSYSQEHQLTNRVVVKFNAETVKAQNLLTVESFLQSESFSSIHQLFPPQSIHHFYCGDSGDKIFVVEFNSSSDFEEIIRAYHTCAGVEYAEMDVIGEAGGQMNLSPNDQYYFRQWGLKNDGSFNLSPAVAGADVQMEDAWTLTTGDSSIIVAIMDSGAKMDHPEFSGRIWENLLEIPGNGIDDDQNGYIDDRVGWDFVNDDNNPTDDQGHGTNVMGILGASGNNSIGYAGVDWRCKLMVLKGLNSANSGLFSWWAEAIYYAVDHGARVINLSVGGYPSSATLQDAITYAINNNVVVVACMMNTNSSTIYYPAAYPGVIAVGSTNPNDTRTAPFFWSATSGSNFGNHISVIAPGNYIYGLSHTSTTNYNSVWGGTSQATPLVAGIVSLLLAQDPSRTIQDIRDIIELSAEDEVGNPLEDTPGWDQYYGHGRVNAYSALAYSQSSSVNLASKAKSMLYPNPNSGVFTITNASEVDRIEIVNLLGQKVFSMDIPSSGATLNIEMPGVSSGLYFAVLLKQGSHLESIRFEVK